MARNDDKRELPPLLVVSSEGSAMYGTTDLATILDRKRDFDPDLMLYVVDQRQADHFEQVFRAAYLAGYAAEGALEHIGFGTMNGPDGKPFKTRAGGVLKLHDLIEMTSDKARERLHEAGLGAELSPEDVRGHRHKVAVAALKFADLANFRGTSYVFDLDRFTSFEGKTGPYLLYQAVRIKSLLRKAAEEGAARRPDRDRRAGRARPRAGARRLRPRAGRGLRQEGAALPRRARLPPRRRPSRSFYAACPVLGRARPAARGSRLALAAATLAQLETGARPARHRDARADVSAADMGAGSDRARLSVHARRCLGSPVSASSDSRGRDRVSHPAPKAQPPRKRSGKRTARADRTLESAAGERPAARRRSKGGLDASPESLRPQDSGGVTGRAGSSRPRHVAGVLSVVPTSRCKTDAASPTPTAPAGARMVEFAGYDMPVQYARRAC